jgi:hypothetical protein
MAGGLTVLPLLQKHGASWNYFLPLFAAIIVTTGGWFARAAAEDRQTAPYRSTPRLAPVVAVCVLAIVLVATRRFPLPNALDEATARAFYGFVLGVQRAAGGPLLVARPDLAYFLAGQREEVEGSSFLHLVEGGAPGVEDVLTGLRETRYSVVVETWPLTERPEWREAIREGYLHVGGCGLRWYFGTLMSYVLVRRSQPVAFSVPEKARCAVAYPETKAAPAAVDDHSG